MAKYRANRRKAHKLKRLAARQAMRNARWNRDFGGTSPSDDSNAGTWTMVLLSLLAAAVIFAAFRSAASVLRWIAN